MQKPDFEDILKDNTSAIYRICRVYAISPIEPKDLFQEVIFEVWKSLASYKGNANMSTWVYRIALNVCMRSKLKLERTALKTMSLEAISFKLSEKDENESDERYVYLRQCIGRLNEADTSMVVLYLEDLSYREIADITGLSENHVAVKMKRIRKKLFECIKPKLS